MKYSAESNTTYTMRSIKQTLIPVDLSGLFLSVPEVLWFEVLFAKGKHYIKEKAINICSMYGIIYFYSLEQTQIVLIL